MPCVDNDGDGKCGKNDCDETNENIYVGALEICGNYVDEDCDGSDKKCNDWPMYRQSIDRQGFNSEEKSLRPPLQLRWHWLYGVDENVAIESSPIIKDGMVYIGTLYGPSSPPFRERSVFAFNLDTGQKVWHTQLGEAVWSTPTFSNGRIIVGAWDGKIYSLNSLNGQIVWQTEIGCLGRTIRASPLVKNGIIYIGTLPYLDNPSCNERTKFYLLDEETGQIIREIPRVIDNGEFYSSPVYGDGFVYAIESTEEYPIRSVLRKFYLNGDEVWQKNFNGDYFSSTPVYYNGKLYVASDNYPDNHVYEIDALTGNILWSDPLPMGMGAGVSSPTIFGNVLYFVYSYKLRAVDLGTKQTLWEFEEPSGSHVSASPAYANGFIYLESDDFGVPHGSFMAIDASSGSLVWQYYANNGVGSGQVSPAVAEGFVCFASYDELYDDIHGDNQGLFCYVSEV